MAAVGKKKGLALAILTSMGKRPGGAPAGPAPDPAAEPDEDAAKETGEIAAAEEVLRAIHSNDPKAFHESLEALLETCYPQLKDGDEGGDDKGGGDSGEY